MQKRIQAWQVGMLILSLAFVVACGGLSSSGAGPSGSASGKGCRTAASKQHSVQTFVTGHVVTTDTLCTYNGSTEIVCSNDFVDSEGGPGTGTQTSVFASKTDLIDEATVNPPLARSLETTTAIEVAGTSFTITATNSYDAQRRLAGTTITNPAPIGGESKFTYSAWDSWGRPTAGTETLGSGRPIPITLTYDDSAHTVIRNIPPNICTDTYDQNGIMLQEECTGTTASKTVVTIKETQQICN